MNGREAQVYFEKVLSGVSDLEIRELAIEALRTWRARRPEEWQFSVHGDLGPHFLRLIAQCRKLPIADADISAAKEPLITSWQQPWAAGWLEFFCWLTRAGLAVGLGATYNDLPITYRLTRAGDRFLKAAKDHPLIPGFVERVQVRCLDLPDGVVSLLADAQRCIEHGLLRPAVVVMGVAFEVATEEVVDALVARAVLPAPTNELKAAARIAKVRKLLVDEILFPGQKAEDKEKRGAALQAYDFADALRRRRNDAAHTAPTYGFEDREEIEELLVSAGRHLPALWSVR